MNITQSAMLFNDIEDLKRQIINLQHDVTKILSYTSQIREVARHISVPITKDKLKDKFTECPVCMADVDEIDEREGCCQNCGQELYFSDWSE